MQIVTDGGIDLGQEQAAGPSLIGVACAPQSLFAGRPWD